MLAIRFFSRSTYFLLFLILTFFILIQGQQIFIPLVFSIIFAFIALPLCNKFEQFKFPRWLAVSLSVILIAITVIGVIIFLSYQISQFSDDLPMIKAKLNEKVLEFQKYIKVQFGYSVKDQNKWFDQQINTSSNGSSNYLMNLFSATSQFIANATLIPIMVFFMLLYRSRFTTFIRLIDKQYHFHSLAVINEIGKISQFYLKGLFLNILILSVLKSIGFMVLKVEHAILFSIIASLLSIIPYIGVLLGTLIPMMMVLVTQDNSWAIPGIFGVTVAVQFLNNNFIYPKVVGSSVKINPLSSLIALLVGNLIWGTTGMILALPVAGMLKVIMDNIKWTEPYGYLMGDEEKLIHKSINFTKENISALRQIILERSGSAEAKLKNENRQ